jgi:hypothetical protein
MSPTDFSGSSVSSRVRATVPHVAIVAIDHEQPVGLVRQFRAHTQIAKHDFHGDVGAHAHRVGVHEATGGVVLEGQHGLQPFAILLVHGLDQLQRHGLWQIADQVGEVVEFHVLGGGQQFLGVHALDERLAHVFAELDQHVASTSGSTKFQTTSRCAGGSDSMSVAISAGCIAPIMRAAPRQDPSRNAPRSAARRRSLRGTTVISAISARVYWEMVTR